LKISRLRQGAEPRWLRSRKRSRRFRRSKALASTNGRNLLNVLVSVCRISISYASPTHWALIDEITAVFDRLRWHGGLLRQAWEWEL